MVELSIIVPVYNVEKYLFDCLYSIFSQNYSLDKFEVIVVNDGTKDDSMKIVDSFRTYSNLVVIEQNNQGLSAARNAGLNIASGEYVWFIDSDDTIEQSSIYSLMSLVMYKKYDMLCFGLYKIDEETGDKKKESFSKKSYSLLNRVSLGKECLKRINITGCSVRFLFRRNFLIENNLFFHKGIYHEDMEYSVKTLFLAKSVYLADLYLYNYLIRKTGSIMTSYNIKKNLDCLEIVKEIDRFKKINASSLMDKLILNGGALFLMVSSLRLFRGVYQEKKEDVDTFVKQYRMFYLKHFYLLFHWRFNAWTFFWGLLTVMFPRLVVRK